MPMAAAGPVVDTSTPITISAWADKAGMTSAAAQAMRRKLRDMTAALGKECRDAVILPDADGAQAGHPALSLAVLGLPAGLPPAVTSACRCAPLDSAPAPRARRIIDDAAQATRTALFRGAHSCTGRARHGTRPLSQGVTMKKT